MPYIIYLNGPPSESFSSEEFISIHKWCLFVWVRCSCYTVAYIRCFMHEFRTTLDYMTVSRLCVCSDHIVCCCTCRFLLFCTSSLFVIFLNVNYNYFFLNLGRMSIFLLRNSILFFNLILMLDPKKSQVFLYINMLEMILFCSGDLIKIILYM